MDTKEVIQEISAKKVNKKLEKAGLSIETINSQGESVISKIESMLQNSGADTDKIFQQGMKLGQSKKLAASVKKAPGKQVKKILKNFAGKKLLGSNPDQNIVSGAFVLKLHGISTGLIQRFSLDSDYAYLLTAMSLSSQLDALSSVKDDCKTAQLIHSWVSPLRSALKKYKQKDIQKVMLSFILTNSNLPFLKKAWKRGKARFLGISATGLAGLAVVGTVGGHMIWYVVNSYDAIASSELEGAEITDPSNPVVILDILQSDEWAAWDEAQKWAGLESNWVSEFMEFSVNMGQRIMTSIQPALQRGKELGQQGMDAAKSAIDKVSDDITDMISSS